MGSEGCGMVGGVMRAVEGQRASEVPNSIPSSLNDAADARCRHWGQGDLETGDYMLGTFRAHVHLSHNVTSG